MALGLRWPRNATSLVFATLRADYTMSRSGLASFNAASTKTMDALTFVSKLVEALAWPSASILLVALLRSEIRGLVPFIKRLRAGPVEAEFERELKQLRSEVEVPLPQTTASPEAQSETDLLLKLAQLSPRSAILEAWQQIEAATLRIPLKLSLSLSAAQGGSPITVARTLSSRGLLGAEEFSLFHELRALRNQAAHASQFSPTPEAAMSYIDLSSRLLAALDQVAAGH